MQYTKDDLLEILKQKITKALEESPSDVAGCVVDVFVANRLLVQKIIDGVESVERLRTSNLIHGVGIVDIEITEGLKKAYACWRAMIRRATSEEYKDRKESYRTCAVDPEWLVFSNFLKFFNENYIEGYQLDKDILIKGNKLYSKDTCCFVPAELNGLVVNLNGKGVYFDKSKNRYKATISIRNKQKTIASCITEEEAIVKYKGAKKKYIFEMATDYREKDMISEKIANVLISRANEL